nr:MAG TPA: hypothetical protein [Caudoviricetes sp.]
MFLFIFTSFVCAFSWLYRRKPPQNWSGRPV